MEKTKLVMGRPYGGKAVKLFIWVAIGILWWQTALSFWLFLLLAFAGLVTWIVIKLANMANDI